MAQSSKDIQLLELKDTISQLNSLIKSQSETMISLQNTIEDLKLQLTNKDAEVNYL